MECPTKDLDIVIMFHLTTTIINVEVLQVEEEVVEEAQALMSTVRRPKKHVNSSLGREIVDTGPTVDNVMKSGTSDVAKTHTRTIYTV